VEVLGPELLELEDGDIAGSKNNREEREYKSYHVLWVEWVDNVAYRRGNGMAKRFAWKAACPEPVSLILC